MTDRQDLHRTEEARQALLDQVAHLVDEVEALRRHVDLIPVSVLEGRPIEGDPSFKELYVLLALYDDEVYGPAASRLTAAEGVRVDLPSYEELLAGSTWDDEEMDPIITRVQSARARLVDRLGQLSVHAWRRSVSIDGAPTDVFGLAYGIVQHDADVLRTAAYRLHESRLTSRDEDLPK